MEGAKATALDAWAAQGRAVLRFDYAGCGESGGDFEAQSFRDWRGDALDMIDHVVPEGPVVLVGSSMGGWLMLLAAHRPAAARRRAGRHRRRARFHRLGLHAGAEAAIRPRRPARGAQPLWRPAPTITTRTFWESGEAQRLLHVAIPIDCPVRLLHGMRDADVPLRSALELMAQLRSADVQTILVKDGDHRLSRDQDIALLLATVVDLDGVA